MGLSEEPDGYRVPQAEPVTAGFRRADLPVPPLLQQALDRVVEFDGFGVHPFVPDALDSSRPVAFENSGVSNVRPDGREPFAAVDTVASGTDGTLRTGTLPPSASNEIRTLL